MYKILTILFLICLSSCANKKSAIQKVPDFFEIYADTNTFVIIVDSDTYKVLHGVEIGEFLIERDKIKKEGKND